MANQVSNNDNANPRTLVSRFDSNKLLPNGAMPTRNGVKGQNLGRVSRQQIPPPQDTFESTQNTAPATKTTQATQTQDYVLTLTAQEMAVTENAPQTSAQSNQATPQAFQAPVNEQGLIYVRDVKELLPMMSRFILTDMFNGPALNNTIDEATLARVFELGTALQNAQRAERDALFGDRDAKREDIMQIIHQIADELMDSTNGARWTQRMTEATFSPTGRERGLSMPHLIRDAMRTSTEPSTSMHFMSSEMMELARMLEKGTNTAQSMPDSTLEQRAMQREATLRMAQELADNFMDEGAARVFMAEIERRVGNDARREQGFLQDFHGDYTHNPFAGQFAEITPNLAIRNQDIFIAERLGISRDELIEIHLNGGHRGSAAVDADARNRYEEVRNMISAFFRNMDNRSVEWQNFTRDFAAWQAAGTHAFLETPLRIANAMEATANAFDELIANEQFASVNSWMESAQVLMQRMIGIPTQPPVDTLV